MINCSPAERFVLEFTAKKFNLKINDEKKKTTKPADNVRIHLINSEFFKWNVASDNFEINRLTHRDIWSPAIEAMALKKKQMVLHSANVSKFWRHSMRFVEIAPNQFPIYS